MGGRFTFIFAVVGVLGATTGSTFSTAVASDIIDEWANVKTPAAPEIKTVTVDPKTTALIMGDFMNQNCGKRPRCVAALPAIKKLLGEARAAKVTVIYSINLTPRPRISSLKLRRPPMSRQCSLAWISFTRPIWNRS